MAIPRIIHQTLPDKKNINPIFLANVDRLKYLNENWDHRLYDNNDCRRFISDYYSRDFLKSYDRINPLYGAVRADFFRYLLMYEIGGVYLDIKSTANKKLDDILEENDAFILSHWSSKRGDRYEGWGKHPQLGVEGEFQQWHIIAAPHHPFLEAVISSVKSNIDNYYEPRDGVGQIGVLKLTGPVAYTLAIQPIRTFHAHRLVDITDLEFDFSVVADLSRSARLKMYGNKHYSTLTDPIVINNFAQYLELYVRRARAVLSERINPVHTLLRKGRQRLFP